MRSQAKRLEDLEKVFQPDTPKIYICWCGGEGGSHIPDCPCHGVDLTAAKVVTVGIDLEAL
jgi:hypothetical protein